MNPAPLVSVVIPAYNAEDTIRTTLLSVLSQTYPNIEIVVVDDGSTDRTSDVVERIEAPIQFIPQENSGVSAARNKGIEAAKGRYIALLDADDVWHPDKISKQVTLLESIPEIMGAYVGVIRISKTGEVLQYLPAIAFEDLCRSLLLHSSVIPNSPSSLLLRREAFSHIGGFDPEFSQCADWDFLLRASLAIRLTPVSEWLVKYRTWSGNMSSNISLLERDTLAVLSKFYSSLESATPFLDIKRRVYSNHWMILSGSYLHNQQFRDSLRCLANALREDPTNLRYPLALPVRFIRRVGKHRTAQPPNAQWD